MTLGENIYNLRKKTGISQEQLGEQIGVTRQTISNWELNETSPNTEQLKLLSKSFNISIDDLLDNDIKTVLVEKVSNTEKLAGIVIKILKVLGIAFAALFTVDVIALIVFILIRTVA
ncbi:MAG: helix-turn-helix transcriptional regulator [Clostridia bacterium]|nr:helix-turn-helix transcriptional regulator [Clostridia bacterium]